MRVPLLRRPGLALLVLLPAAARAQQSFFGGIGDFAGGQTTSYANGLSADGQTVVGEAYDALGLMAAKHTRAGGLVPLGRLAGNQSLQGIRANAVSADGSMIVGYTTAQAVYWKNGGPAVALADVTGGGTDTYGFAVSDDGKVAGGRVTPPGGTGAGVWTGAAYNPQFIGDLPGGFLVQGAVTGMSATGSVLVGYSSSTLSAGQGNFAEFNEAFRYANGVMAGLGDLPGGRPNSNALAASADGSVVVGFGTVAGDYRHAFRWTQATGMVDLLTYNGALASEATAISSDGLYIAGGSSNASIGAAVVWTATRGWLTAQSLFDDAGVGTAGWQLGGVTGIERVGDVLYMCGNGAHNGAPEGWYAGVSLTPVPEPAPLAALGVGALAMLRRRGKGA